jgi:hypothetical protein
MAEPLKDLLEHAEGCPLAECRECEKVQAEMARRLRALDELHSRVDNPKSPHMKVPYCSQCGDEWPCDSRRILDGENSDE